jgi:hypothetical protein
MSTNKHHKTTGVDALAAAVAAPATVTVTNSAAKPAESPSFLVRKLKVTDVILGRGSGPNQKIGNIRFREVIWTIFHDFLTSKFARKSIASSSIQAKEQPADKNEEEGTRQPNTNTSEDVIPAIPDELFIKPIDAAAKNLIASRVADKMKQSGCLFVRKLTKEEERHIDSSGNVSDPSTVAADGAEGMKVLVRADEGSLFIEVSTKETHEKIKQALRFLVGQKEREIKGGNAAAAATAGDTACKGNNKKRRDMDRSHVSSPPLKKSKSKSLPATFPADRVPRELLCDRNGSSGLYSSQIGQAQSLPMFNSLKHNNTMNTASFLSDHRSVDWRSTGIHMPNYSSTTWPHVHTHSSQPNIFSQLGEVSRFFVASPKARQDILSAASSTTTHRPVNIQDLQSRRQQELKSKQQEVVSRQQEQHRTSLLSELMLHRQIKEELEQEAAAQASQPVSVQSTTDITRQIHQLEQLQQLQLLNRLRTLPRDAPLATSMEFSAYQRRSASLDLATFAGRRNYVENTSPLLLMSHIASAAATSPSSSSLHDAASRDPRSFLAMSGLQRKPNHIVAAASSASAASTIATLLSRNSNNPMK